MIASFVFDLDSTVLKGELLPAIGGLGRRPDPGSGNHGLGDGKLPVCPKLSCQGKAAAGGTGGPGGGNRPEATPV